MTHSIFQAPLQSELRPVYKSTSQDQKTPFWSFSNHHPVSLISLAASLNISSLALYSFHLSSHLSSLVHLLSIYTSGSAIMPSHIPGGSSVTIPSI
jgi:hypothetical protein